MNITYFIIKHVQEVLKDLAVVACSKAYAGPVCDGFLVPVNSVVINSVLGICFNCIENSQIIH